MKKLIWANFKMNKTTWELKKYLSNFKDEYACFIWVDVFIAPVSVWLSKAREILEWSCINLWAQNVYYEETWAYTWEISPIMLEDINCKYVIIWHSERRQHFWETNEIINKKIKTSLKHSIRPVLCIWENLKQKELWLTKEILKIQILEWLEWINIEDIDIAYEPIWAIWTWLSAWNDYIEEIHSYLKTIVNNNKTRIIYGWSVNTKNAKEIWNIPNVDWFLIWSASLESKNLLQIIQDII